MARRSGPGKRSGGTPATAALERAGVAFTVHPYDHDLAAASYGLEAAEQLGLDPAAVFKTLLAEVDGCLVVGISPLGQKKRLTTVINESALERPTVYVSGGKRGLDIGVAPHDLIAMLDAQAALIGRT